MEPVKYKVTWKTFALPIIGLAAFLIYILIFNVDIQEIIAEIRNANPYLYLIAIGATLMDTLFFTLAWRSLLGFLTVKISRLKLLLFVWIGIFIDTMIPAESVSGELARIYLVNKEQNGAAGKATASIVAQRLIGTGINIATLIAGAVLLVVENLMYGIMANLILFLVVIGCITFALILVLSTREDWTVRIVDAVIRFAERISRGRWKLNKFREEAIEATKAFHVAIKEYAHAPKTLFISVSFSVIAWMLTLAVFYFTFLSIGYTQISWSVILVVSAIFMAVKSVPVGVPFEVGLPEITLTFLFNTVFGIPLEISATATILTRLLTLWLRFFMGFVAEEWIGIKAITMSKGSEISLNN